MKGRSPRCRMLLAAVAAVAALILAASALFWQCLFDYALSAQLMLTPVSRSYHEWLSPPPSVPIYFDVYMFNWTNPHEFPGSPPKMEEIGPYRFKEDRRKVNVTWHPHNNSVSYRNQRIWHFDPITSNGSLDDNITSLNVIAASAVYRAREWSYLRQKGLSVGLDVFNQGLSVTSQAGKLLFEGYEDPLLDLAKTLPHSTTGGAPPVDRFGWFYERNNSLNVDGHMEVSTGSISGTLPGQILKWNYLDNLPYYSGDCAKLVGSMGEFLPRGLTPQDRLPVFLTEVCRSVFLDYDGDGEMHGLEFIKFAASAQTFDNDNSKTSCFCGGECVWSGVMNVSACRYGSPAFVTLPHFLHADPELRQYVQGLQPDPEKHSFFFAIEPKLGIPLEVAARFQLNILLQPNPNIALYANVTRMLFPILWIEQHVLMDDGIAAEMRLIRSIADWGSIVCVCVAVLFSLATALLLYNSDRCRRRSAEYAPPPDIVAFGTNKVPKEEAEVRLCSK